MTRFIIAALVSLAASSAFAQQPNATSDALVVTTGEGVVQAVPDRAWITISAESRAQSPREAQRRNTEAMTPVQEKLRAAGIAADAIRTVGYDVQYEWDYVNNRRVGRGYVARNSVEVRVDDVAKLGEFLEIAVASGATSLGGIRFDLKDRAGAERQPLRLAVADARMRADAAAAGANVAVAAVIRIEEQGVVVPVPRPAVMMRAAAAEAQPDTPMTPGEIEVEARVQLTATIK